MRALCLALLVTSAGCRCAFKDTTIQVPVHAKGPKAASPPAFDGGWSQVRLTGLPWTDLTAAVTPGELTHLSIDQLPNLVTTRGLNVTRVWTQTDVWNNPALTDLGGLSKATLSGRLAVLRNPSLQTLGSLSLVRDERFGLRLEVRDNPALTSLGSLGPSLEFNNMLILEGNPKLTDLDALESMTACNSMRLRGLGVRSLQPLEHLRDAHDLGLDVSDNPALTSLAGLEGVRSLSGLTLENDAALENLDALSGVVELRVTRFVVRNNPKLRSLAPLLKARRIEGIPDESGTVTVDLSNNPLVPAAEVEALRRRLTAR